MGLHMLDLETVILHQNTVHNDTNFTSWAIRLKSIGRYDSLMLEKIMDTKFTSSKK